METRKKFKPMTIFVYFAVHVFLGPMLYNSPYLTVSNVILVFGCGIFWALFDRRVHLPVYAAAYIVGAEVLWRGAALGVIYYESGKYAVSAVFATLIFRRGFVKPFLPFLYFICLIPSTIVSFDMSEVNRARMSFSLSGPMSLMICVLAFSKIRLTPEQIQKTILVAFGPILSTAVIIFKNLSQKGIKFETVSNIEITAKFGPNQVSLLLGLGFLFALLYLVHFPSSKKSVKLMVALLGVFFAFNSAVTFSRSGLYCAAGAFIAGSLFMVRNVKLRFRLSLLLLIGYILTSNVIIPKLDEVTGGAIKKRFGDIGLTKRDTIMLDDLRIFRKNIMSGVGPGQVVRYRHPDIAYAAPHTEYTRLLAEHGLFGGVALLAMMLQGLSFFRRHSNLQEKSLKLSLLSWSVLFMASNGMRIVAPSFLFGFAAVTILSNSTKNPSSGSMAIPSSIKALKS